MNLLFYLGQQFNLRFRPVAVEHLASVIGNLLEWNLKKLVVNTRNYVELAHDRDNLSVLVSAALKHWVP